MWSVLAVEDCAETRRLIALALATDRILLRTASSAREARAWLEDHAPDLVLLDVALPDGNGYEICAALRTEERLSQVPVIFLTSKIATQDKVAAFALGADDYVAKPFDPLELRARVEARLRKASARVPERLRKGSLQLYVAEFRASCVDNGVERDLALTPHEFRLLHHLARYEDRIFTRGQLLSALWGDTIVSHRTIDTHVSNLRRKLGPHGHSILSVRGVGYRFRSSSNRSERP